MRVNNVLNHIFCSIRETETFEVFFYKRIEFKWDKLYQNPWKIAYRNGLEIEGFLVRFPLFACNLSTDKSGIIATLVFKFIVTKHIKYSIDSFNLGTNLIR